MAPNEALNEAKISAADLLAEIKPLLEEVYFGQIICKRRSIVYKMPNGQSFRIYVSEVK